MRPTKHIGSTIRRLAVPVALATLLMALVAPAATAGPTVVAPTVIRITVKNGRPVGGIKRPVVKKGTLLRIVVVVDRGKGLHLHGYDFEKTIRPGKPTVFQFVARLTGRFELELHTPDALLAQLTVKP